MGMFLLHLLPFPALEPLILLLGPLVQFVRPLLQVIFLLFPTADGSIQHVRHSPLELVLKLMSRLRSAAWLPPEELPRLFLLSAEGLLYLRACSPVLTVSLNFVRLHLPAAGASVPRLCPWP